MDSAVNVDSEPSWKSIGSLLKERIGDPDEAVRSLSRTEALLLHQMIETRVKMNGLELMLKVAIRAAHLDFVDSPGEEESQ